MRELIRGSQGRSDGDDFAMPLFLGELIGGDSDLSGLGGHGEGQGGQGLDVEEIRSSEGRPVPPQSSVVDDINVGENCVVDSATETVTTSASTSTTTTWTGWRDGCSSRAAPQMGMGSSTPVPGPFDGMHGRDQFPNQESLHAVGIYTEEDLKRKVRELQISLGLWDGIEVATEKKDSDEEKDDVPISSDSDSDFDLHDIDVGTEGFQDYTGDASVNAIADAIVANVKAKVNVDAKKSIPAPAPKKKKQYPLNRILPICHPILKTVKRGPGRPPKVIKKPALIRDLIYSSLPGVNVASPPPPTNTTISNNGKPGKLFADFKHSELVPKFVMRVSNSNKQAPATITRLPKEDDAEAAGTATATATQVEDKGLPKVDISAKETKKKRKGSAASEDEDYCPPKALKKKKTEKKVCPKKGKKMSEGKTKEERPCPKCGGKFPTKTGLEKHYKSCAKEGVTDFSEIPFFCQDCDEVWMEAGKFRAHMGKVHAEKPYSCDICGIRFTEGRSVYRHKFHVHDIREGNPYTPPASFFKKEKNEGVEEKDSD